MKDARVKALRDTLQRLLDSLDATIRVARWDDPNEAVPEPLKKTASDLPRHLETAQKLAAGKFVGSTADTPKMEAMHAATERLVLAYSAYQANSSSVDDRRSSALALEDELGQARAGSDDW
jgi:hypothetical protein